MTAALPYAEIAVTTNFSFLRGASHPRELVLAAALYGYAAIGVADRNTLAGVVRAYEGAAEVLEKCGTAPKLLVGSRLVFVDGTPDILAYPTDRAAYGRLCRLLSTGKLRAAKGECILRFDDLIAWQEGLLFVVMPPHPAREESTSDPFKRAWNHVPAKAGNQDARRVKTKFVIPAQAGIQPPQPLKRTHEQPCLVSNNCRRWVPAFAGMTNLKDVLGKLSAIASGRVWLGVSMPYRGDDRRRLKKLVQIAREADVPLIATNDVLYHAPERRPLQDIVTCIREHRTLDDAGRLLEHNAERHLKPPQEMAMLFRDAPEAIAETIRFADRISFSLDQIRYNYPDEPVPKGKTAQQHLEDLTWVGAARVYPNGIPDKLRATLAKELRLIAELETATGLKLG